MALYVIGDTHLSLGCDKPMDIFPRWEGYVERLRQNWCGLVQPEDTVVVAGDISWAMHLEHCMEDFAFLHALPGRKILLKGNHDYWWTTRTKMERFTQAQGFDSLSFLFNNSYCAEGLALCGTRSWMYEPGQPHDEKVMAREVGRLRFSLEDAAKRWPNVEKLVFLHYPPVYPGSRFGQVMDLMAQHGVKRCYYGHLHAGSIRNAVQGPVDGIDYRLVSADSAGFCPVKIIADSSPKE